MYKSAERITPTVAERPGAAIKRNAKARGRVKRRRAVYRHRLVRMEGMSDVLGLENEADPKGRRNEQVARSRVECHRRNGKQDDCLFYYFT